MADTITADGLAVTRWDEKYFVQHVQGNRFASEMGSTENSIIHVKEDLSKQRGETVNYTLVNRLTSAGVTGNTMLKGAEEALNQRSQKVTVELRRNGVLVTEWEGQRNAINLRNAAREALLTWSMENTRDRIIGELGSIDGIAYGTASAAQKNTWQTNNSDRVLFGNAKGNDTGVHSTSLANVSASTGKLQAGTVALMKRIARDCNPKIRPYRSQNDSRYFYILYAPPRAMRDLKADPVIQAAQKDVVLKMENERIFKGGDVHYDGVIVKEIEDIPYITGAGASSIDLAPVYLCGAQALGYAVAKRWQSKTDVDDYDNRYGVGIREIGNFAKMRFGTGAGDLTTPKDHGIVSGFVAGVADA